jgi:hypothetical protein
MISSFLAILFATYFPRMAQSLSKSGGMIGVALMQVFIKTLF